jgi:hypothetical protein
LQNEPVRGEAVLRTAGIYDQSERRGQAVAEVRDLLVMLYRGFVAWVFSMQMWICGTTKSDGGKRA